jgi:hypothetical protein
LIFDSCCSPILARRLIKIVKCIEVVPVLFWNARRAVLHSEALQEVTADSCCKGAISHDDLKTYTDGPIEGRSDLVSARSVDYNGRIRVHKSLLNVVLHDGLADENPETFPISGIPDA